MAFSLLDGAISPSYLEVYHLWMLLSPVIPYIFVLSNSIEVGLIRHGVPPWCDFCSLSIRACSLYVNEDFRFQKRHMEEGG